MKVAANFLLPLEIIIARMVLGCVLTGLILFVSALVIAGCWLQVRAEIPELRQQAVNLSHYKSDSAAGNEKLKTAAELNDIRQRIQKLNGLKPGYGRNISEILFTLENIMPAGAAVKSLNYKHDEDAVLLEIESADASFLQILEKGNPFARMTLVKQSKPEKSTKMLYEIRLAGT